MADPQYGFLGSGYGLSTLRQYGIDPLSWGKPAPNPITGRSDYGAAPAGALQGAGSGAGSPATGFIPFVPSPATTQGQALAANAAAIPALRGLFSGVAETYIPGASQKFAQEGQNVSELLNPGRLIDTDRYSAEQNAARGISGSPAGFSSAVRRRDDEILKRQLLGSQLLSSIAQRGEGMLPLPSFMITPDQQQQWQYLANQLAAAPNPASAYNLAGANAALGIQAGMRAGYGRGGGAAAPTYGGNQFMTPQSSQPSAATTVVNKYGPSVGITPSQGAVSSKPVTDQEIASRLPFDYLMGSPQWDYGNQGWETRPYFGGEMTGFPKGIPTEPGYVAPYMNPLLTEPNYEYDWAG